MPFRAFLPDYLELILIPAGLITLLIAGMWITSLRHAIAKTDPMLKFLDTASPSGLHPSVFDERLASYASMGLLRNPLLLRRVGYLTLVTGVTIAAARSVPSLVEGSMPLLGRMVKLTVNEVRSWPFWTWLIICAAANVAAKRAESRAVRSFMSFVTLRAVCVAAGACVFLARATQPPLNLGAGQYLLAAVGVVAAVITLVVLNLVPFVGRLFASESVQIFWEGAVPSLLLIGLDRIIWSTLGCIGFAVVALILGALLVGIPGLFFVLKKQVGTPRERRISARVLPLLNAAGGLLALQANLAFLVVART